jgi:hypothetical protein
MRSFLALGLLVMLCACAGLTKGSDVGIGFDAMDTTSKEQKENEAWFNSYYGASTCTPTWGSECPSD